jgi:hypothetical protein
MSPSVRKWVLVLEADLKWSMVGVFAEKHVRIFENGFRGLETVGNVYRDLRTRLGYPKHVVELANGSGLVVGLTEGCRLVGTSQNVW